MKNVTLVLAMILFLSCVTSKVTATELESSTNQELFLSRHLPRFHPKQHWPFRGSGKAFPAGHFRLTPFHLPQEVTRCLNDKKEVGTCFNDIAETFFTRKAAIGSECCAAIKKMNKDCEKTVFGSFHDPFLTGYVKLHFFFLLSM
uniref:Prolamin-like domain-containing protein n=1 Tax=Brassica oleracea var. oleracea TaxID=109376 RepID=A0A0D3EET7_BRAOL